VRIGAAPGICDCLTGYSRGRVVEVQNVHDCALRCELLRDCLPDPATTAGDDSDLAVQSRTLRVVGSLGQRETPRFQGMKSSCAFCSALVRTLPLAT
jgi:hypothetical protein